MKIAIISITEQGQLISDKLYSNLDNNPLILHVQQYHKNVKETIKNIFNEYDCIIGIMASGIMIRSIAPYVNSKLSDPAILLVDDNGNFVISLLCGHFGGANDLTHKIADLINATPVITTSTDVNNKIGIDSIAKHYYCSLENTGNIKFINRALVDDRKVELYLPSKFSFILTDSVRYSYNIHIDNTLEMIVSEIDGHKVILKPRRLVMGIGARKNIATSKVEHAVLEACKILEVPVDRIDLFATADVKAKEQVILDVMSKYDKILEIVEMSDIKNYENNDISKSDFVMKQFGVKGVCEPSCLIVNGDNSELIFKKTANNGVTIAVSVNNN